MLLCFIAFIAIVVCICSSSMGEVWKREMVHIKTHASEPVAEMAYTMVDIYTGGELTLAEFMNDINNNNDD